MNQIYIDINKINSSNPGEGFEALKQAIQNANPELAKMLSTVSNIADYELLVKARNVGLNITSEMTAIYGAGTDKEKALLTTAINNAITKQQKSQTLINGYQKQISGIQKTQTNIANLEQKINDKYDARLQQLEKVKKLNDQINQAQQDQLSLAEALNKGDIGAAARAAQQMQQNDVQRALDNQQTALQDARQRELKPLQAQSQNAQSQIDTLNSKIQDATLNVDNVTIQIPKPLQGKYEQKSSNFTADLPGFFAWMGDRFANAFNPGANSNQLVPGEVRAGKKGKTNYDWVDSLLNFLSVIGVTSATGGYITGPGTGTSDSIPARLSNGEYVIRANAVKKIGVDALDKLNYADRFANGGYVMPKFAMGGYAMGTDTVPAMLTPGEFVIKKSAVDRIGTATLNKINGYADGGMVGGSSTSVGDSVYNYSINVNVRSDANPNDIARAVMTQIKQIDNHRVRGSAF